MTIAPKPARYPRRKVVEIGGAGRDFDRLLRLSCGHFHSIRYWSEVPKTVGCGDCYRISKAETKTPRP